MVYMTDAYALYFGFMSGSARGECLILEIDTGSLDKERLYPDEDFIAQALAHQLGKPLTEVHDEVRIDIESYRHHAKDSLAAMGNIAHKGVIPATAITRYAMIDCKQQAELAWIGLDPCITPINYQFLGPKYRSMIAWVMGDREDFITDSVNNATMELMEQQKPGYMAHWQKVWSNRKGISVITNGEAAWNRQQKNASLS